MTSVQKHYAHLLSPIYGWMLGGDAAARENARSDIASLHLVRASGRAVDLGAGLGFHSLSLAELGYRVTAVDSSAELLGSLKDMAKSLPVHTVEGDLVAFRRYVSEPCNIILCMGDTLTHLPSKAALGVLMSEITDALTPDGVFCATFRDYTVALEGDKRFIPVRSDEERSLTCFLEYEPDIVTVHDLLHERGSNGWTFKVSSYPKLRLDPAWVAGLFEAKGNQVMLDAGPRGMVRLVARAV